MFNIKNELKKLPEKPGVYIMKDKDDNILYVGKAISLKKRVKQYFMKNNKTARIEKMVSLIDHFEYVVTDNEVEALLLECNFIKQNKPKFNVLLKDDKTYPYIKIDMNSDFPNIYITRNLKNDGSKYFGPYANPYAAKEMLSFIRERFQIRQCKTLKPKKRPCINYEIKKCLGPCANKVSKEEYKKLINQIIMLLEGKTNDVIKQLTIQMDEYSKKLEYEKAAMIRDKINAIKKISEKQKMSNLNENSIDVIGLYKNEMATCIEVFFIRNSKMIGREHFFLEDLQDEETKEILSSFIKQYYTRKLDIPNKIMLQEKIQDEENIKEMLNIEFGKKVEFKIPQKGEKLKFIELAINNAKITLTNRIKEKQNILTELQKVLEIETLPRQIECFDISNLSGEYIVAGMCVAKDGVINKKLSKRFKVKTVFDQDDPKCLEEVVGRRINRSLNKDKAFGRLPDVIFADGGITQIRAIKRAVEKYNLQIPVFGMVKDDKHRTKKMIDENKKEIKLNDTLMNFITNLQDEVHKVAIEYNRKLRDKETTKSNLDEIEGIGEKRKLELLKNFGSIEQIKKADINELTKIKGITEEIARNIKKELD